MEKIVVRDVVDALLKLPTEQLATVYEFVLFLQSRHGQSVDISDEWTDEDLSDFRNASLQYAAATILAEDDDG